MAKKQPRNTKPWWELKVEPVAGELGRFRVESVSRPSQPHTVDFSMNGGAGFCSCEDCSCRREPRLLHGAPPLTPETMCIHMLAASRVLLYAVTKKMSQDHP